MAKPARDAVGYLDGKSSASRGSNPDLNLGHLDMKILVTDSASPVTGRPHLLKASSASWTSCGKMKSPTFTSRAFRANLLKCLQKQLLLFIVVFTFIRFGCLVCHSQQGVYHFCQIAGNQSVDSQVIAILRDKVEIRPYRCCSRRMPWCCCIPGGCHRHRIRRIRQLHSCTDV